MNISAKSEIPSIAQRKQHHIDVCRESNEIEGSLPSGFDAVNFVHHALPEISLDDISTEWKFLGKKLPFPLFISCMTGGSPEGKKGNEELAKAAQKHHLPFGLGSMRVLFDHPERLADFQMRHLAPDIPILANIGAVQLRDGDHRKLLDLLQSMEVDALVVHLNCGQELFHKGGDRDFSGLIDGIKRAIGSLKQLPIIVKETGFGIRPILAETLLRSGATYIDGAGAGGTNWAMVEEKCSPGSYGAAKEFASWGIPTAQLIAALKPYQGKILASGGIRSGMDVAKAVAMGALAAGMALPMIRAALEGGADSVSHLIEHIEEVFRAVMLLTGSKNLIDLQRRQLIFQPHFEHYVLRLSSIS